jgi:hypothetical protein
MFMFRALSVVAIVTLSAVAPAAASVRRVAEPPPPAPVIAADAHAILPKLRREGTIGSTIDPINGDQNPYGLTISPVAGGSIAAGDLVVCNFNDAANIQGLGTTLEVLHPVAGAKPLHLAADPTLTGCAALAMGDASPWVAALDANDNPIVSDTGSIVTPINNYPWTGPWGQAFVAPQNAAPAFYETNANDGSIVRINLGSPFTFDKIAIGLPVNHGVPGSILAPSGLTYDVKRDILYVVDGAIDAVVAIHAPEKVAAGGIVFTKHGFSGPSGSSAHIVFAGAPLNAPISSALLFNGNLVVGNTGDNRIVELAGRRVLGTRLVDSGSAGAIFGMVASGTSAESTRLYFNDDNDNTVKFLAR